MARPKEFDEAEVLDHAMALFRARGFEKTSFSDLVSELQVSRQSLYDTYGDKRALYHAALTRYLAKSQDWMRRQLDGDEPVRTALQRLFDGIIGDTCCERRGCLMVNSAIENAAHDPEVRALAQQNARHIEGLFASRLSAAQRRGELRSDLDPVAVGRFFYHTLLALGVAARTFGEPDALRETVRVALRALD